MGCQLAGGVSTSRTRPESRFALAALGSFRCAGLAGVPWFSSPVCSPLSWFSGLGALRTADCTRWAPAAALLRAPEWTLLPGLSLVNRPLQVQSIAHAHTPTPAPTHTPLAQQRTHPSPFQVSSIHSSPSPAACLHPPSYLPLLTTTSQPPHSAIPSRRGGLSCCREENSNSRSSSPFPLPFSFSFPSSPPARGSESFPSLFPPPTHSLASPALSGPDLIPTIPPGLPW